MNIIVEECITCGRIRKIWSNQNGFQCKKCFDPKPTRSD